MRLLSLLLVLVSLSACNMHTVKGDGVKNLAAADVSTIRTRSMDYGPLAGFRGFDAKLRYYTNLDTGKSKYLKANQWQGPVDTLKLVPGKYRVRVYCSGSSGSVRATGDIVLTLMPGKTYELACKFGQTRRTVFVYLYKVY